MANFVTAGQVSDVPPGTARCVTVGGKELALFNIDGTFYVIDNTCLHRGGPLAEGELDGTVVTCPWHGWQYDVTTGVNVMDDAQRVQRYDVRVEGGEVLIAV